SPTPSALWDVYALGATVYILLTGHLPRLSPDGTRELSFITGTRPRLVEYRRILYSTPVVDPRTYNREVDEDLAAIVLRCLCADPGTRADSALFVARDLQRRRDRFPVYSARPWTRRYRFRTFMQRERRLVRVAQLILLLAACALAWI